MAGKSLEELIWDEQDGVLSPAERRQLDDLLESSGDARRLRGEVADLVRRLDGVEQVEPPPELRGRIRRGLSSRRTVSGGTVSVTGEGWLSSLQRALRGSGGMRPAYATAALVVVALAAVFWAWRTAPEVEKSRLVGTVNLGQPVPVSHWLELRLDADSGVVALRRSGESLVVESDLTGIDSARLEIRPVAGRPERGGLGEGDPPPGERQPVAVDLAAGGLETLELDLDLRGVAGLDLELRSAGELLLRRFVAVEEIPGGDPR